MPCLSDKQKASAHEVYVSDFAPERIVEIEIGQPLPPVSAVDERTHQHYRRALCLVRLHTQPLGLLELQLAESGMKADEYAQHIWGTFSVQINEHLQQDGLPRVAGLDAAGLPGPRTPRCIKEREQFLTDAPFVSVIVPTHDRPEGVRRCLRSLLALDYPQYEVIVVDNAPSTNATADFIQQTYRNRPQVRYLREDRRGPSWARNCGIMAARGEILAFVDDDIIVDSHWLVELVRGFSLADGVACVTGLVSPLELETPAQFWFEEYGGYGKGFSRRVFDMRENRPKKPLYPYTIGLFGTGGSMAFRASFLRSVGGFDSTLGSNRPALCAEDTGMFFQVITRGYKLVYTPASLVYHPHHRDYTRLRKQIYHYGIGLTAHLMKSVLEKPGRLFDLVAKLPYGFFFLFSARSSRNSRKSTYYPKELTMIELKGMLYGPIAYMQSRRAIHDICTALAPDEASIVLPVAEETLMSFYDTPAPENGEYF